jgi:hypothetical protein
MVVFRWRFQHGPRRAIAKPANGQPATWADSTTLCSPSLEPVFILMAASPVALTIQILRGIDWGFSGILKLQSQRSCSMGCYFIDIKLPLFESVPGSAMT